jgi:hypothetical protein
MTEMQTDIPPKKPKARKTRTVGDTKVHRQIVDGDIPPVLTEGGIESFVVDQLGRLG